MQVNFLIWDGLKLLFHEFSALSFWLSDLVSKKSGYSLVHGHQDVLWN